MLSSDIKSLTKSSSLSLVIGFIVLSSGVRTDESKNKEVFNKIEIVERSLVFHSVNETFHPEISQTINELMVININEFTETGDSRENQIQTAQLPYSKHNTALTYFVSPS